MDTAQWPQVFREVKTVEGSRSMTGKKPRPQKEQALNCPRCNSTNTKFCYYNNYSLTQPRYFCKTCRRYWTEGGSLRNVPVGGGSRKNKRSTSSSVPASSKRLPDLIPPSFSMQSASQNPKINNEGQDLNLAYPPTSLYSTMSEFVGLPTYTDNTTDHHQNPNFPCASTQISAMEVLKTGIASQEGLTSFISLPHTDSSIYSSDLPLQELKPSLDFSMNGNGHSGYGNLQGTSEIGARLFFPYEDLKSVSSAAEFEQNRVQEESSGYWNGVVGGGTW